MRFETLAVHAGAAVDPSTGAVSPPLHLSTTFEHGPGGEELHGYSYIRDGNPTQSRLEEALCAVEGGQASLFFASGVAAGASILQTLAVGSHVLFPDDVYNGFRRIQGSFFPRWGVQSDAVDMSNVADVRAALRPNTKVVWAESPSNPLMKVMDLAALSELAKSVDALLIVDNTFATPALQNPLALGADVVLHSATKYLGGHSDIQGGALVFAARASFYERILQDRKSLGSVASPFNAWLILRGLRSLSCRMEQHSSSALTIARALESHRDVEAVHYPGLTSHPGHEVARKQMRLPGGMLSFRVRGDASKAIRVASKVRIFINATSLGGPESLIEHRASHEGSESVAPKNLLRVSVGLEHPDDLIEDLMQALAM
jgi:cystathionine gamma-synthase